MTVERVGEQEDARVEIQEDSREGGGAGGW